MTQCNITCPCGKFYIHTGTEEECNQVADRFFKFHARCEGVPITATPGTSPSR